MLFTLIAALAVQTAAVAIERPDPAMFSERVTAGRAVGDTDAVGLCANDDEAARADMERIAVGMLLPRSRMLPMCTFRIDGEWRVVRRIADRCLAPPGQEWCEVEAHAVLMQSGGRRRYAVIVVTADQLD